MMNDPSRSVTIHQHFPKSIIFNLCNTCNLLIHVSKWHDYSFNTQTSNPYSSNLDKFHLRPRFVHALFII